MQLKKMEFHSEPSSPKQWISPFGQSRSNSMIDEFEFGTSCRFDFNDIENNLLNQKEQHEKKQEQREEDYLPAMAFADELFSDGKVLPLLPQLKLPPGHERKNDSHGEKSSTTSSPRSPGSALKIKFLRQNLWNDDFDPFFAALQSVKEEASGETQANSVNEAGPRSPFPRRPNDTSDQNMNGQEPNPENGPTQGPKMLKEPKGLAFARAVVKMDHEIRRPNMITMSGPILRSNDIHREGEGSYRGKRRNKLMKLLSLFGKFNPKSVRGACINSNGNMAFEDGRLF